MHYHSTILDLSEKFLNKYRKEFLEDLQNWIKINSVYDANTISEENPFGKNVSNSLNYMYTLAKREGFEVENHNNYAVSIKLNKKAKKSIGIIGHCDTVPFAGQNWSTDPLSGHIEDNFIHGRGAQDDKGPVIAAFWGLKFFKDAGFDTKDLKNTQFQLILGGDEERSSKGIAKYLKTHQPPMFSYTPDGMFPVVFNENEKADFKITIKEKVKNPHILEFEGGIAINVVPSKCTILIYDLPHLEENFTNFLAKHLLKGKITEIKPKTYQVEIYGIGAHAAELQNGLNAITHAAEFLSIYYYDHCPSFINFISEIIHNNIHGHSLNIYFSDKETGVTSINLGLIKFQKNECQMMFDIRWPHCVKLAKIRRRMKTTLDKMKHDIKLELVGVNPGLYIDPQDNFLQQLDLSYRLATRDHDSKLISTSGGTYARMIPNCVAFGMLFPQAKNTMHQADERINIKDLFKGMQIYTLANYNLAQLLKKQKK